MVDPVGRWLRLAIVVLGLWASATAQLRRPAFVTVVDGDGQPVAGAEVIAVAGASPLAPGATDVQRATTDARGRCQPRLVLGRRYSAWAIAAGDGVARAVSEPTDVVGAGKLCELVLTHRSGGHRVTLERLEGALPAGGEVVFLPFPVVELATPLAIVDDEVELPAHPWAKTWLAIRDRDGALRQLVDVPVATGLPDEVDFERPHQTVLVQRAAGGEPGPVVAAQQLVRGRMRASDSVIDVVRLASWQQIPWRPVPDGEPGAVELTVTSQGGSDWFRLRTAKSGFCYLSDRLMLAVEEPAPLPAEQTITGALKGLLEGEHVAGHVVVGLSAQTGSTGYRATFVSPLSFDAGRLEGPGCASAAHARLVLQLLPDEHAPVDARSPRLCVLPQQDGMPAALDVDLDALHKLQVRVETPDGRPAPGVMVGVWEFGVGVLGDRGGFCASVLTDLQAEAELLLGTARWAIYATDGHRHCATFLEPPIDSGPLVLRLEEAVELQCRCVDSDGKPVRGARLERAPKSVSGFGGRFRDDVGQALEEIAWRVAEPLLCRARSDGDGQLRAPVQQWRTWHIRLRLRAGDRVSEPFEVQTGELGEIVLR